MISCTGTKHPACFPMVAYRVSQHVPVHPCLTHSLVAGCHLPRKADTMLAVVPFFCLQVFSCRLDMQLETQKEKEGIRAGTTNLIESIVKKMLEFLHPQFSQIFGERENNLTG